MDRNNREVEALISTSVSDAEITLKSMLAREPKQAKTIAELILDKLAESQGQKTRINLAQRIIRQAEKALKQQ
ncbi:hypothetical protein LZT07_13635 [Vibrio fluvialis]|uniref:hypothetical protein n=1 Tax=Vibrio fluvialis TaxID=676 RepID=UPI001F24F79F|nr:hypothetical protein [Vibrio fluvialis]MCE7638362.1 hypothetical protein [Vibrio fluvialis]